MLIQKNNVIVCLLNVVQNQPYSKEELKMTTTSETLKTDGLWAVPAHVIEALQGEAANFRILRERGEAIDYEAFVTNLFNNMNNAADALHHAGTGISSEAGEVIDITKGVKYYGKALNLDHLIEELGDVRFYYQAMLNMLNLTDEQIQAANIRKLSKRYPDGIFTNKHAQQRLDKVEEAVKCEGNCAEPRKFMGQDLSQVQPVDEALEEVQFHEQASCTENELMKSEPSNPYADGPERAAWSLGYIMAKHELHESGRTKRGRAIVEAAPDAYAEGKAAFIAELTIQNVL